MTNCKEILSDKINWKIINMIVDKMIRYEDKGLVCKLNVCIPRHSSYISIYTYVTDASDPDIMGWRNMYANYERDELRSILRENGWMYQVYIVDPELEEESDGWMDKEQYSLQTEIVTTGRLEFIQLNSMQESEFREK